MIEINPEFFIAICFCVFAYIAFRPLKKMILNILDKKIVEIKQDVLEAQNIRNDAQNLLNNAEIKLAELANLKTEIMSKAGTQVTKMFDKNIEEIETLIKRKRLEAEKNIESKKLLAIEEIKTSFIEMTTDITANYLQTTKNNNISDVMLAENLHSKKNT